MTTSKLKLDLPLVMPEIPDVRDQCVHRLLQSLESRDGMAQVHITEAADTHAPQLCVHYDTDRMSLARVCELALAAGAQITDRYGHLSTHLPTALHANAARTLTAQLHQVPGVLEADVSPTGALHVEFDRTLLDRKRLDDELGKYGLSLNAEPSGAVEATALREKPTVIAPSRPPETVGEAHGHPEAEHGAHDHGEHAHGGLFGDRTELIFALLTGVFALLGWLVARSQTGGAALATGLFVAAYALGGWFTGREALDNLRAKRFEIDALMLVAALGAAALGKWAEGALLLFLFSLGHALEHWAMERARRAIQALADLAPQTAMVKRGQEREEVPVERLVRGDIVIVRPNERLPADGIVVAGHSSVNQAPITGESVPVDKRPAADPALQLQRFDRASPEHRVYAGTINGAGALEVQVARPARETTLARVMQMVTEAETQRSPTQQFTERVERVFVPIVLGLAALILFAWVVVDEPFSASFYRAMAVLVAASPCALAISVPSAVLSGVARAARAGVLVKGGAALENLGTLTAIAFDKTGTLTEGKPRLTDVIPAPGISEEELLQVALAVEQHSEHPIAAAIVTGAQARLRTDSAAVIATAIQSLVGRGVTAMVDGKNVHIGKPALFNDMADAPVPTAVGRANDDLVASGRTTMIVKQADRYLGVLGVMDTPRAHVDAVMHALRQVGMQCLVMISGDNQRVADAVARHVGLTEARGDLLPDQKVEAIRELRHKLGKVAMVGDGVNDAPAMATPPWGLQWARPARTWRWRRPMSP